MPTSELFGFMYDLGSSLPDANTAYPLATPKYLANRVSETPQMETWTSWSRLAKIWQLLR